VPESPQSLYIICRLYIKEDILCSNQDPNPNRKGQKRPPNVGPVTPATSHCCLTCPKLSLHLSSCPHPWITAAIPPPLARPAPALRPAGGQRPLRGSSPRSKPSIHSKRPSRPAPWPSSPAHITLAGFLPQVSSNRSQLLSSPSGRHSRCSPLPFSWPSSPPPSPSRKSAGTSAHVQIFQGRRSSPVPMTCGPKSSSQVTNVADFCSSFKYLYLEF
jgi:hypothetical protein